MTQCSPSEQRRNLSLAASFLAILLGVAGLRTSSADTITGTTGGGAPFENRQPTLVTRYIIALQGIFPTNDGSTLGEDQPPDRSLPYLAEIKAVAFNFAPSGWAFCEGQTLPISQNTALFALLGTTFGGDGRTTFKLPDLRGRVPIGVGQGFGLPNYVLGQQVGVANPNLSVANLPSHTHTVPGAPNTLAAGSGAAVDNRQPALALRFLIAADGEIMLVPFNLTPGGWTVCDGRVFPVAGHSYAFFHIGSAYGGDGGVSSFAVPDTRGRIVLGDDNTSAWPIAKTNGLNDLTLGLADIPAHTHTVSAGTTGSAGGTGNTANNYQPSLVMRQLMCIYGIFPSANRTSGTSAPLIGEMRLIAGTMPNGLQNSFQALYGQLYPINQNQALFSLIGTSYGGNGQSTFAAPDLRARANAAVDGTSLPLATVVGSPTLNISLSQLASHAHPLVSLSITGIQRFSDGSALLTLQGTPGISCQVDKSDNLSDWSSLGQVNFGTATQTISDPNPTHATKRFYRAHTP